VDEESASITGVNQSLVDQKMEEFRSKVDGFLEVNMPESTPLDWLGAKVINEQELGILPASLPYKKITELSKYSTILIH
jgi:hypothetical protein